MVLRALTLVIFNLACASAAAPPAARAEAPDAGVYAGSWGGRLTFRDEPLDLRLDVERRGETLAATLDFPQLVYADQPAEVEIRDGALAVALPFGLGESAFELRGGELVAESTLGEDRLRVVLRRAAPFEPERRTITFGAAEPPIEGTLVLPPGEGPFPLVLLTAGSGNPHRGNWSYTSWADPLARRGLASFAYDRRPDDERSAAGGLFVIEDHARDLVSALDRVLETAPIDPDRIGVLGKSRGAWIGLAAATLDARIDFLASIGPAAVGIAQQDLQSVEARMRAAGEPEAGVQAALAYMRVYFHVAAHPDHWPRLAAAAEKAGEADWEKYVRRPEAPSDLEWFAAHLAFDPKPMIAGLAIPIFCAWGAADIYTPPLMNRPLFAALLAEDVAERSRLRVYDGAGHSLEGPLDTDGDEAVVWTGLNPDFLADLWTWLEERGFARPGS